MDDGRSAVGPIVWQGGPGQPSRRRIDCAWARRSVVLASDPDVSRPAAILRRKTERRGPAGLVNSHTAIPPFQHLRVTRVDARLRHARNGGAGRGRRAEYGGQGRTSVKRYAQCTMGNVDRLNSSRLDSDALRGGDGPRLEESGRAGELGSEVEPSSCLWRTRPLRRHRWRQAESGKRKAARSEDRAGPRSSTVRQRANGVGGT
jgi:hypothetical protein